MTFGWFAPVLAIASGLIVLAVGIRRRREAAPKCGPAPKEGTARRAVGNALFLVEEFVNPRMEHVLTARQERNEDDAEAGGDDPSDEDAPVADRIRAAIRAALEISLAHDPIDPDEVRRHLTTAARAGLDWRSLYDQAARDEVEARAFRAPFLPPAARVAPRLREGPEFGEDVAIA